MLFWTALASVAEGRKPVPAPPPTPAPVVTAPVPAPAPQAVPVTDPIEPPCGWPAGTSFRYRFEVVEERTAVMAMPMGSEASGDQELRVLDSPPGHLRLELPASTANTTRVTGDPLLRQVLEAVLEVYPPIATPFVVDVDLATSAVALQNEREVLASMARLRSATLREISGNEVPEPGGVLDAVVPEARAFVDSTLRPFESLLQGLCRPAGPEVPYSGRRVDPLFSLLSPVEGSRGATTLDGVVQIVDVSTLRLNLLPLLGEAAAVLDPSAPTTVPLAIESRWVLDPTDGWPTEHVSKVRGDVLDQSISWTTTWTRL